MAPRRSAAAEEEEQEQDTDLVKLKFSEPLSWRPGKPIATEVLLRRLDKLDKELADLDQETTDKDSLTHVAKELVSHNLLGHKDKGVKAFLACCLVDVLRICAPNAPFTHAQLKDVFNLFVTSILPALQDPSNTYHSQHKYVLFSLSEVQSIVLLNDVENNETLLLNLFSSFFDAVSAPTPSSGQRLSKEVEHHMTEILVTLIEEGASLPPKAVDVIMAQFLRAAAPGAGREKSDKDHVDETQSTLLLKEEPPAYQMAKSICNSCSDRMARFIAQYFSDVLMDYSSISGRAGTLDSDDEEGPSVNGPSEADLKELRKAHLLLRELWRAVPVVLPNVIPQLEAELSADNVHLRQLATETLGDMISGIGAAGPPPPPNYDPAAYPPPRLLDDSSANVPSNVLVTPSSPVSFAQTHPSVYHNFVLRKQDKYGAIRAAWATAVGYILSTSAGGLGLSREEEAVLVDGLGEKLTDADEKVRLSSIKAVETFSFKDVMAKLAPHGGVAKNGSVLCNLADRIRDRKSHVRIEAMVLLGKLWAAATGELAAGDEAVIAALSAIPSRILSVIYVNDLEINALVDRIIFEYLIPLSYPASRKGGKKSAGNSQSQQSANFDPDTVRAERILLLFKYLDEGSKKAIFALQARQPQFATVLESFLQLCEAYNGGVMDNDAAKKTKALDKVIEYLGKLYPDPAKVSSDLHKFAKINDRRNYQLVRFIIGPEHDFKTMHRALKELVKRLQGSSAVVLDTLVPILYRGGCIMFNRSHLPAILEHSKSGRDELSATALEILSEVSQRNPQLFRSHVGELCKTLASHPPSESTENEPGAIGALKACAAYAQKYPQEMPRGRNYIQTWISYASYGQPEKAAKYALSILLASKDEQSLQNATELLQRIMKDWKYESPRFRNNLIAATQLELLAPDLAEEHETEMLNLVLDILSNSRTNASPSDPGWVDDSHLERECFIKLDCFKFLVKKLRGSQAGEEAQRDARNLLRLLVKFVVKEGEMCKTKDTPKHHRSRLRLGAALSILKVCTQKEFDELLAPKDFDSVACVAQDPNPQVRRGFIEKLQHYLGQGRLRPRFYTMVFLAAFEPSTDFKRKVETWIRSRVFRFADAKQNVMEATMARLLSLLAHHPDYSPDPDLLVDHARYLLFYLNTVATESNIGLIYKYAERVKQTVDAVQPDRSDNLYLLSDLAQSLIRKWQEKRNWTFQPYPGRIGLPAGLYSSLPSHEVAQSIAEKQYLPEGMEEKIDELLKAVDRKKKRKSTDDHDIQPGPAKKAKATAPKSAQAKHPRASAAKSSTALRKGGKTSIASRPKKRTSPSSPMSDSARRRSGRARVSQSYVERDSDEDDEEMLEGVAEWDYVSGDEERRVRRPRREPESDAEEEEEEEEPVEEPVEAMEEESDEDEQPAPPADRSEKPANGGAAREDEEEVEVEEEIRREESDEDEDEALTPPPPSPPPPSPPRANGRRGRPAAAASATKAKKPVAKPAPAKGKTSSAKAGAAASKAPTRSARGRPARKAKDAFDMDEDD